jgi:DNA-binding transcriptional ArsR family regulator
LQRILGKGTLAIVQDARQPDPAVPEEPPQAAATGDRAPRQIDASALHGLAHPLRVRIFDELTARGPATATDLARRFGESSGATSYHLRQLARHGFIEEETGRGGARERWWRTVPGPLALAGDQMLRSPATREAARLVLDEWSRTRAERLAYWLATITTWPSEWVEAAEDATSHLRLRVEELAALKSEVRVVVARWADAVRGREEEGLQDVEVQFYAFPLEPPGGRRTAPDAARDPD